jgi:GTP-binding protein Era
MTEHATSADHPTPAGHRSGFVAIAGRPNVGKSTLVNALMGQKIAAVSPRPQTTRRRQLGILTRPNAQIIFVDTPGLHKPLHKLGELMNEEARATLKDADVAVFLVDASQPPSEEDRLLADYINGLDPATPVILALNKIDQARSGKASGPAALPTDAQPGAAILGGDHNQAYQQLVPRAEPFELSALLGYRLDVFLDRMLALLPEGPPYYEEEQITDLYEREIAADLVREAALVHLRDEVPHSIGVRVEEYRERGDTGAYILATIFVERESHKPILIGQGGEMLKKIGTGARKEIEVMSGRKVFLELRVKVQKNWRNMEADLRHLGYLKED